MNYKHGMAHSRIDSVYKTMIARCYNVNNDRYKNYGARGIKVCDEWRNDRTKFFEWALNNGYDATLPRGQQTIERIDRNGNYCPENCTFVDYVAQANNRSTNHFITYGNETHTIREWEKIKGINPGTLWSRLKSGWDVEKALTTPAVIGRNQFTR